MYAVNSMLPSCNLGFRLSFSSGLTAQAIYVESQAELPAALNQIDLPRARPTLVLVGGAGYMSQEDYDRLQVLFTESLAPLAQELGMTVIDGGTDTGLMQLMGRARAAIRATFPLVGVAPIRKVKVPDFPAAGEMSLEPHHSHFVFVPGAKWGDESPWIATLASVISGKRPSITVLMNGGNASLIDVRHSIAQNRPVVVIAGTGRLADEIATAMRQPDIQVREALTPVLGCPDRLALFDLSRSASQLKANLQNFYLTKNNLATLPSFK